MPRKKSAPVEDKTVRKEDIKLDIREEIVVPPPAWAKAMLESQTQMLHEMKGLHGRVEAVESWVQRSPSRANPQPMAPPKEKWYRCETCNQPFGPVPEIREGSPRLCPDCANPNTQLVTCYSCKQKRPNTAGVWKSFKMKSGPVDKFICRTCAKCVICGDKSDDKVCYRCITLKKVRICEGCTRQPLPGSAWCKECDPKKDPRNPEYYKEAVESQNWQTIDEMHIAQQLPEVGQPVTVMEHPTIAAGLAAAAVAQATTQVYRPPARMG